MTCELLFIFGCIILDSRHVLCHMSCGVNINPSMWNVPLDGSHFIYEPPRHAAKQSALRHRPRATKEGPTSKLPLEKEPHVMVSWQWAAGWTKEAIEERKGKGLPWPGETPRVNHCKDAEKCWEEAADSPHCLGSAGPFFPLQYSMKEE